MHRLTSTPRRSPLLIVVLAALAVLASGQATAAPPPWLPAQIPAWNVITQRTQTAPVSITNGVEMSSESVASMDGVVPIDVVTADTTDPNVDVRVVSSHDHVVDPDNEVVTSMANRTGAVAGINGGYFDMGASGQPNLGQIVDGEIWKSPAHDQEGTISVLDDGSLTVGKQEFTGTIEAGSRSHELASINWVSEASEDAITMITPRLGEVAATWTGGKHVVALGTSTDHGATIAVTEVKTVSALDQLPDNTYGLLAGAPGTPGAEWLQQLAPGDQVTTDHQITPNDNIEQMVQGPGRLLKDGQPFDDPNHQMPNSLNPESAVGVTDRGELVLVTFDGRRTADTALGVHPDQVAGYLQSRGVDDAVLLDGGGSSTLVGRQPGDSEVSVLNDPSDENERPVADGLFLYSTASEAGPVDRLVLNADEPVATVAGATVKAPLQIVDAAGNPADTSNQPTVSVSPDSLGTWSDGEFTARRAGSGTITATLDGVSTSVPVTVVDRFEDLSIQPSTSRVKNGEEQQLTVQGSIAGSDPITLDPSSVTWSLDRDDLGTISPEGVFTAAEEGAGVVVATAAVGDQTVTATINAGSRMENMFVADDPRDFSVTTTDGATSSPEGRVVASDDVPEGLDQDKTISFEYWFQDDPKQQSVYLHNERDLSYDIPKDDRGIAPELMHITMKVENADPKPQPEHLVIDLVDQAGNRQALWMRIEPDQYNHWFTTPKKVQWGKLTQYPLKIDKFRFVGQNAQAAGHGRFHLARVDLSYPAAAPEDEYEPIASGNPDWLQYEQSTDAFRPGGTTYVMGDDGHLIATQPHSSSAVNVRDMARRSQGEAFDSQVGQRVEPVSAEGRPELAISLGDISDTGEIADQEFAKQEWEQFGVPLWDVVGNHETSQGELPANENFHQVFGQDTHFSFVEGNSTFISVDSSQGGVTASNGQQVPAREQYPWLVEELENAQTDVIFVATHWPAHDPLPNKSNQFQNRWEAEQYLEVINAYRAAHPEKRVVMFYGHSRAFASQFIDPQGRPGTPETGIPQFTIADIGTPPYTAPDKGGFYHFALMHVNEDGTVQYTVEPMLQSVIIDQGTDAGLREGRTHKVDNDPLPVGGRRTLTATALNTAGDGDGNPPTMPVADPMSHVWASSNDAVATVHPVTGEVTAVCPGEVTISVTTGGITSEIDLVVKDAPTPTPTARPTPTEPGTTPTPGEPTPSDPDEPTPSDPGEPTPSEPGEPTPSEPGEPTPSEPGEPDPSTPATTPPADRPPHDPTGPLPSTGAADTAGLLTMALATLATGVLLLRRR